LTKKWGGLALTGKENLNNERAGSPVGFFVIRKEGRMKILITVLLFVVVATTVFAQPDPRDSVILESKTVAPGSGAAYATVKVWITNKDSLLFMSLPLIEKSTSGGAYGILPRHPNGNFTFGSVITNLTPSLRYGSAANFSKYNSGSPDTFLVGAGLGGGVGESGLSSWHSASSAD